MSLLRCVVQISFVAFGMRMTHYQGEFQFKVCASISFYSTSKLFGLLLLLLTPLLPPPCYFIRYREPKRKRKSLQALLLEGPENNCHRVRLHHGCLKIMCKVISDSPSIYIRELVIRREIRSNARAGKCLVTWPGKPRNFSQLPKV